MTPTLTKLTLAVATSVAIPCATAQGDLERVALTKQVYLDKCRGAWAGQMIGVAYGAPYEFEYVGRIQEDPIRLWKPAHLANSLSQDDLYVELTWLSALEKYGLDITFEQAGKAFAETTIGLAEANNTGRENVRHGIMPPMSGHPRHNRHADDIDFQIESDLFGIICPGLPQESNRLCDVFGHIMNHGDGVYGGMFVSGMYCAAYFEDKDVEKVIRAGLACIPAKSLYHKCISDVIRWYHEHPDDWRATWGKIEDKWQDDVDCVPGSPFNIDAKLNGAYIVIALLYGGGDLARTLEIGVRCGQDSDCNPSNAAGILGCMKGVRGLPTEYTAGLSAIEDRPFAGSERTLSAVVAASQVLADQMITRAGGSVEKEAYHIPVQVPRPAKLEQWENQMEILSVAVPQVEVDRWDARWQLVDCGYEFGPGHKPEFADRKNILLLVPRRDGPAVMIGQLQVPDSGGTQLKIPISSFGDSGKWLGEFRLKVLVNGELRKDKVICTRGRFAVEEIDVSDLRAKTIEIRIEVHQEGHYHWERAYFGGIEIE